jgi:outer membrane protein assembly factor BamB
MSFVLSGYVRTEGASAKPFSGVLVSSEHDSCLTDEHGKFNLTITHEDVFVKISCPRGWRTVNGWFQRIIHYDTPEQQECAFVLARDPQRDHKHIIFVQVSDLHIGRVTPEQLHSDMERMHQQCVNQPDFLLVTGDLSHSGTTVQLQRCYAILAKEPVPIFTVPGNHDYIAGDNPELNYKNVFGPSCYSFNWGAVHFIAFDSVSSAFWQPNLNWLQQDLDVLPAETPVVLFTHYQLDDAFFSKLSCYNIVASISGHWHSSRVYHDGLTTHFNGPCLTFGCIDFSPRGFRLFEWDNDQLSARTVALKSEQIGSFPRHTFAKIKERDSSALKMLWKRQLPGVVHMAAPTLYQGYLLTTSKGEDEPGQGYVTCLDAKDGNSLWSVRAGDAVKNSVCCHNDMVIAVTVTGEIIALELTSGTEIWRRTLLHQSQRWLYSKAACAHGMVYTGTAGCFTCLDASSGRTLWERRDLGSTDWISSYVSPVVTEATVVTGFLWQKHGLYGLDAQSGKTRWLSEGHAVDSAVSSPVLFDGHCYIMRHRGCLQKFDPETGVILWERSGFSPWSPAAPTVTQETVYVSSGSSGVTSLDTESGGINWIWQPQEEAVPFAFEPYARQQTAVISGSLLIDNALLVATTGGWIRVLSPIDGRLLASYAIGQPVLATPAHDMSNLYIADTSGCVRAYSFQFNQEMCDK